MLLFSDDFDSFQTWNGTSGWNTKWYYNPEQGGMGYNSELQWYINENYAPTDAVNPWQASNGALTITASKTPTDIASYVNNAEYVSGMINSYNDFSHQYGYFEMRAKLPAGQGMWPAFWLLRQDDQMSSEIDIMEMVGNEPTTAYATVHSAADGSGGSQEGTAQGNLTEAYHTYALDWQKDYLTFYLDGKEFFKTATPSDMHVPMYMIANLAVGGTWPGNPDASTVFPAKMEIDYIKVWDQNPNAHPTPAPTDETFVFTSNQQADAATITTWNQGDKIDLRAIDADTLQDGDQAFRFISWCSRNGNELRIEKDTEAGVTHVYGNTDHDRCAEFEITVKGLHTLAADDFYL